MNRAKIFVFTFIVLHSSVSIPQVISVAPEYEERYEHLLSELRCLVCQNQTVAESPADLSNDLRIEVKEMLERGATDQEILKFMSDRYGDFVLYNPPVKPRTYLLWIGPFLLLAGGLITALMLVKRRSMDITDNELNDKDRQRLKDLLDEDINTKMK
ncbi:MAG: cytochrome c-type biogenesis protein [Gammaproteobacteria bacterium]|nr:cytochrome c-type biogenesis protein [Gammaproteobacteria bacterium]